MSDVLVQTRVPERVAKWVSRRADSEGDTVAGWVRRLLIREASMTRTKVWMCPSNDCDPRQVLVRGSNAHFLVDRLRELTPTASVWAVGWGEGNDRSGEPIKGATELHDRQWFKDPRNHRAVLGGSPRPYLIQNVIYDETAKRWELTLEVDPS